MAIEPLRKQKQDGTLYKRPKKIEDFLEASAAWPFDQLMENGGIRDRRNPDYVPTEVLLYHLRQTKSDNSDARFLALYNLIQDRIEAACPRPNFQRGEREFENAKLAEIRDLIVEYVVDLIFTDRLEYNKQLDFFEIRFDRAVRFVRIDRFKRVGRKENPKETLEYEDDTGEVSGEVEEALDRYKSAAWSKEEDLTYRIHVRQAIDALPEKERKVIDMILADIPIETIAEGEPSISKLLNCSEKTVRNRRDRAIAKIKAALEVEQDNVA